MHFVWLIRLNNKGGFDFVSHAIQIKSILKKKYM
jgi:hypothetical protein